MKKYLLPSALILAFGLTLALAQNITKSIQLSQSAGGPFGVDSNNGVYFPGHVLSTGKAPSAGTGCTVAGTDTVGQITYSSNSIGCTVTFAKAYLAAPICVVSDQTASVVSAIGYTTVTTSIAFTSLSANGLVINYICSGGS
jgi:hypothetical protein